MKKTRILKKLTALALTVFLIVGLMPVSAFAEEVRARGISLPAGELTLEELKTAVISDEDIPEVISTENVDSKDHVNRLRSQEETLSTVVFQNRDGTKTKYHFSYPVKYTDKDGIVKDKSNKLTEKSDSYTNAQNNINAYFPKKLNRNKGVELIFGEYTVELSPYINGNSGASRQTGHNKYGDPTDVVVYPDVFDETVSLRYTPAFEGFKEDIILDEYVGINQFRFILRTNGLKLLENTEGSYDMVDPESLAVIYEVGQLVVYDSSEREYLDIGVYSHSYSAEIVNENEEYIITVTVDEKYLTSEERVWPVYVDPAITAPAITVDDEDYAKDIQDAAIYSGRPDDACGEYIYGNIGYLGDDYKVGRMLMCFPGLAEDNLYDELTTQQILSLDLYLRDISSVTTSAEIVAFLYLGDEWDEVLVTKNTMGWESFVNYIDHTVVSSTGWHSLNLDFCIAPWKSDYTCLMQGIILQNWTSESDANYCRKFFTTEAEASLRPYLSYTYDPTVLSLGVPEGRYLDPGYEHWFKFTPSVTRQYAIFTNGGTDTYGELYLGDTRLAANNNNINRDNFLIFHNLTAGQEYKIKVRGYGSSTEGAFSVCVAGNWSINLINSNSAINYSYNRTAAKAHMAEHYETLENDEYHYFPNGDCANFTSQCLQKGGLNLVGEPTNIVEAETFKDDMSRWYYCSNYKLMYEISNYGASHTWATVLGFNEFWGKKADGTIGNCYQYIEYGSPAACLLDMPFLIHFLDIGDILQYTNAGQHNMIVSSIKNDYTGMDVLYSGHTSARFDASFKDLVLQNPERAGATIHLIKISKN